MDSVAKIQVGGVDKIVIANNATLHIPPDSHELEAKTISSSITYGQVISPSTGYTGLSQVTLNATNIANEVSSVPSTKTTSMVIVNDEVYVWKD